MTEYYYGPRPLSPPRSRYGIVYTKVSLERTSTQARPREKHTASRDSSHNPSRHAYHSSKPSSTPYKHRSSQNHKSDDTKADHRNISRPQRTQTDPRVYAGKREYRRDTYSGYVVPRYYANEGRKAETRPLHPEPSYIPETSPPTQHLPRSAHDLPTAQTHYQEPNNDQSPDTETGRSAGRLNTGRGSTPRKTRAPAQDKPTTQSRDFAEPYEPVSFKPGYIPEVSDPDFDDWVRWARNPLEVAVSVTASQTTDLPTAKPISTRQPSTTSREHTSRPVAPQKQSQPLPDRTRSSVHQTSTQDSPLRRPLRAETTGTHSAPPPAAVPSHREPPKLRRKKPRDTLGCYDNSDPR